ncbi:hypothetical protein HanRHA438_Chr14g0631431 [Helianthus annuus]|uniref:Uncharacterized protein n=1 Tax=Helianthus annuus TaxID=4232 RepID=A0A9K3E5E0_HELAN|nr:hypothetical protein HanXRQr2_Chr14g0621451 [Helianthus annuus]KAJ0462788.1 hypothetical protein HanHA300_Chr14g0508011 [Helianthus annuus]KAJ0484129.1 hypothetical protein HanHA89_Chr14g0540731 [Helianthus annuus]KAJ0658431.1 hypothetical protein HanOQP8_Chr14g0508201 [Helianthus annuus]KAJ0851834.1 hypothetical protein HanRHA438_Chr14g0631431 [Helianthus annuus]
MQYVSDIRFCELVLLNDVAYALDVNVERAEDVITHKRILQVAEDPVNRPAFEVILVQVHPTSDGNTPDVDNVDWSKTLLLNCMFHYPCFPVFIEQL